MSGDPFFYSTLPIFQVEVNRILANTHKAVVFVWRLEFRNFPCDTTPEFSKMLSIKWTKILQNMYPGVDIESAPLTRCTK